MELLVLEGVRVELLVLGVRVRLVILEEMRVEHKTYFILL